MKNVIFTKYGPIDHDTVLDHAYLNANSYKTDGEYFQTGIEAEEDYAFGNKQIMIFGEVELNLMKSI